jgi:hypothetical protein
MGRRRNASGARVGCGLRVRLALGGLEHRDEMGEPGGRWSQLPGIPGQPEPKTTMEDREHSCPRQSPSLCTNIHTHGLFARLYPATGGGSGPMSSGGHSTAVLAGTHHWSGSSFEKLVPQPPPPVARAGLIRIRTRRRAEDEAQLLPRRHAHAAARRRRLQLRPSLRRAPRASRHSHCVRSIRSFASALNYIDIIPTSSSYNEGGTP